MYGFVRIAIVVLAGAPVAACSPGIGGGSDGRSITFTGDAIAVRAPARQPAEVSADGTLAIGGKTIATTPAQRTLLRHLYGEAHDVLATGRNQTHIEFGMAGQAALAKAASILNVNDAAAVDREAALSQAMMSDDSAQCRDALAIARTERAVARELPPFAPYAPSRTRPCAGGNAPTSR